MQRRRLLQSALALGCQGFLVSAGAGELANFPSRPIRVLVGFAPGTLLDPLLRVLAEEARAILQQPIILEARPGAAGVIPALQINHFPADGYSLAMLTTGVFRAPYYEQFKGDPSTDLTYVIGLSGWVFGLVVPFSSSIKSLADYIAYARQHPGALSYASPGVGSVPHCIMEELQHRAGIKLNHVPFKGTTDSLRGLAGGHIHSAADASGWVPYVDRDEFRLLCLFGNKRLSKYPQVPTLRESGFDIADSAPWGLVAPKGTPPEVVQKLHLAFKSAMESAAFRSLLSSAAMEPAYMSPSQYREWAAGRRSLEIERASRFPMPKNS